MRLPARLLLTTAFCVCVAAPSSTSAANCSATVLTGLAFGTYDPFSSSPLDTTARLELKCSAKATARLSLSEGSSGTSAARELRSGAAGVLQYNVYLDAARQTVWTSTDIYTSSERAELVTMYARIFAGQLSAPAGTYRDTLVLTISY